MINNNSDASNLTVLQKKGMNSKSWKKFDFYVIFVFTIVILIQSFSPYFLNDGSTLIYTLYYILYLPQIYGIFPVLFDFFLLFYIIKLIRINFSNKQLINNLAKKYKYKSILLMNYIILGYLILLFLFSPPFNPLSIFELFNGSYPAFTIINLVSIFLIVILILNLKKYRVNTIYYVLINALYYFLIIIFLSNYVYPITDFFNFSYLIPVIYYLNLQTFDYKYLKSNLNSAEINDLLYNDRPPAWIMISSGVFETEEEYSEAIEKKCKNKNQLELVRKYDADSYETALDIMERDFPSYEVYKQAFDLGYTNYREWKLYEKQNFSPKEKRQVYEENKKILINMMKNPEVHKITINQLLAIFDLQNSRPLMLWMINIPEYDYVKVEGDAIVLDPKITDDQINRIVNSLISHLTSSIDIN